MRLTLGPNDNPRLIKADKYTEITAVRCLEKLAPESLLETLKNWAWALDANGVLRVSVPDYSRVRTITDLDAAQTALMEHGSGALFNYPILYRLLIDAGFVDVQEWKDAKLPPYNLSLQARKRNAADKTLENSTACGVISMPRFGPLDCILALCNAMTGIAVRSWGRGAWWYAGLSELLRKEAEKGTDIVVCCDYDSLVTRDTFLLMLQYFINNPHIDALTCKQNKREAGPIMATADGPVPGKFVLTMDRGPQKVRTAHFGFTFIRPSKLAKLKKPWFKNVPCDNGDWTEEGPGRIQADIYFWRKWEEAGNNLYLLPTADAGHLELLVAVPDKTTCFARHLYMDSWNEEYATPVNVAPKPDAKG